MISRKIGAGPRSLRRDRGQAYCCGAILPYMQHCVIVLSGTPPAAMTRLRQTTREQWLPFVRHKLRFTLSDVAM